YVAEKGKPAVGSRLSGDRRIQRRVRVVGHADQMQVAKFDCATRAEPVADRNRHAGLKRFLTAQVVGKQSRRATAQEVPRHQWPADDKWAVSISIDDGAVQISRDCPVHVLQAAHRDKLMSNRVRLPEHDKLSGRINTAYAFHPVMAEWDWDYRVRGSEIQIDATR